MPQGGLIRITPEGGLEINGPDGTPIHHQNTDGTSYHGGDELFNGIIIVQNPEDATNTTTIQGGTIECELLIAKQKDFRIDHPLDPENKYLHHSSIETNEIANIYNGNAKLDKNGTAEVELPDWFDALNENFRYQLTPIGAPGPNLYVASEVKNNRFKIAGGNAGMKVSWQVVGTRKDNYAIENPLQVESFKESSKLSSSSGIK